MSRERIALTGAKGNPKRIPSQFWTNRIDIIDGFLKLKKLKSARAYAKDTLEFLGADDMLTKEEKEYLKLVVSLKTLEDFIDRNKQ